MIEPNMNLQLISENKSIYYKYRWILLNTPQSFKTAQIEYHY